MSHPNYKSTITEARPPSPSSRSQPPPHIEHTRINKPERAKPPHAPPPRNETRAGSRNLAEMEKEKSKCAASRTYGTKPHGRSLTSARSTGEECSGSRRWGVAGTAPDCAAPRRGGRSSDEASAAAALWFGGFRWVLLCFLFFNLVCCAASACVCARSVIGGVVCGEDGEAFICEGEVGGGGATLQRLWLRSGGHDGVARREGRD
jgi:hypothetical protein